MSIDKELMEFWDKQHREQNIRALSGNGYITIFYLHLDDIFPSVKRILNIGVGVGKFERACVQSGKVVDSVDISNDACKAVQHTSNEFYPYMDLVPDNTYDLITELLVAQHLTDDIMENHIKHAIRALTHDGIYAVQCPDYINPVPLDEHAKLRSARFLQGGRACRSEEWFRNTARQFGGAVIGDRHRVWVFPEYNMKWYTYHIRRKV